MISKENKDFNNQIEALIRGKDNMPLDVYISKMKALKNEINSSMLASVDHQYKEESIIDQAKQILNFALF